MDMAVANLLKHKIRFVQFEQDSDRGEPFIPNKGYYYISNWIENGESVGIRSGCDLFVDKLKPLFLHIISTIYHEAEMEVSSIDITVGVFDNESYDYDIVKYEFTSAPNDAITNYSRSWVYPFPEGLLNNKFTIYIESYVYMVDDYVREIKAYYEEQMRLFNQEVEENEPLTPPVELHREDRCVVCLEAKPNILYLDCLHIAICDSCDRLKTTGRKNCDMCRSEILERIKTLTIITAIIYRVRNTVSS